MTNELQKLENSLDLWIDSSSPDCNTRELIQTFWTCRIAQERFMKAQITWDEYLEILDACHVQVDDYRDTVEENLISIGL